MTATAIGAYATATALKTLVGITDTSDDTLIGLICDRVNAYIEFTTKRVIAPVTSATFLLDGDGSKRLYFPRGIRAISVLAVGDFTGDDRDTLASTDYFLRPLAQDRKTGWPAMYVVLSDLPAGLHATFPVGFETVSLTATTGWAAIPDEITEVALAIAQRAWNDRQAGVSTIGNETENGFPDVTRYVRGRDREVLRAYTVLQPQVVG